MRTAALGRPSALGAEPLVLPERVQNGAQQPARRVRGTAHPIQDELRHRGVGDQLGAPEHLQMPGNSGLGQFQYELEVRDEEGRRGEAVENAEPGRLRDREEQVGG